MSISYIKYESSIFLRNFLILTSGWQEEKCIDRNLKGQSTFPRTIFGITPDVRQRSILNRVLSSIHFSQGKNKWRI